MAEKCANKSSLPSTGVMKPKPFESLNHFTVPIAIFNSYKKRAGTRETYQLKKRPHFQVCRILTILKGQICSLPHLRNPCAQTNWNIGETSGFIERYQGRVDLRCEKFTTSGRADTAQLGKSPEFSLPLDLMHSASSTGEYRYSVSIDLNMGPLSEEDKGCLQASQRNSNCDFTAKGATCTTSMSRSSLSTKPRRQAILNPLLFHPLPAR